MHSHNTYQAKYFDGITSRPQYITISIVMDNIIVFEGDDGIKKTWHVDEIDYDSIGSHLEIHNKSNRNESIKIDNKEFSEEFFRLLSKTDKISFYQRLIRLGVKGYILFAVIFLSFVVLGYVVVLPWVAEKAVSLIPESFDTELGNMFVNQFLEKDDIDSVKTAQMNEFASLFEWNNTKELHFTVVKSDMINAFAIPNGNIVIYTALLDKMKNYDELVGLIGHEVTHINNRHSMRMLSRNVAGYLFISAVFSDVNGIITVITENVHQFNNLTYSRHFENEADREGTLLIIQNNVDPNGMLNLFKRLKEEEKFTVPVFMSTHPYSETRTKNITELIEKEDFEIKINKKAEQLFKMMRKN